MTNPSVDAPQQRRLSAEEIRAARVAELTDPQARDDIQALLKERTARLSEVAQEQKANHERRLAELTRAKVNARNAPQLTPSEMKPAPVLDQWGWQTVQSEARADLQRLYTQQSKLVAQAYDRKLDQRLDAAERSGEPGRAPRVTTWDRDR
ncbi:hypothetical protein KF840_23525 [bacterium]|nr:hypothetical protein [bacterium]